MSSDTPLTAGMVNYGAITRCLTTIQAALQHLPTDGDPTAPPLLTSARDAVAYLRETVDGLVHEAVATQKSGTSPTDFATAEIVRQPIEANHLAVDPIFVVGTRRSGTTLLGWMLDSHPRIASVPENYVCGTFLPLVHQTMTHVSGALGEPNAAFLRKSAQYVGSFFTDYAARQGKPRWATKEVLIAGSLDLLDRLFNYQSRFIYIVRHGFDAAFSAAERFEIRGHHIGHRGSSLALENYVKEWVEINEATLAFCARNRERCYFLRYEDLVERPESVGRDLFAFIGESWDDDLLDRMQRQKHPLGLGDNKILETGGRIDRRRRDRWQDWPAELIEALAVTANPTLVRLGYPEVPATKASFTCFEHSSLPEPAHRAQLV